MIKRPLCPGNRNRYTIPDAAGGSLIVYDVSGRQVRVLKDGHLPQGTIEIIWNGQDDQDQDVASGGYFVRLVTGQHSASKKVVLIR